MAGAAGVSPSAAASVHAPPPPHTLAGTSSATSNLGSSFLSSPVPSSAESQYTASNYAGTSNLASEIPANLQSVPWVQDLLHPHAGAAPLASVPNLAYLEHPDHVTSDGLAYPAYAAAPAPLGVTDYGLGATAYSYNASYINGQVTFTAAPNVTQPAATNVIAPSADAERLGYVGSEYEFGIQLNTIGSNLSIPGTYNATTNDWSGFVWAQNVVNWNATGLHFIQDTWNFSLDSNAGWQYNSIYSGCGGNTAHANYILYIYGVFQCSEGNVPLTAVDYPVTLSLYNNFTTNAQDRSQLVYGYSIYEAGTGTTISGVADTVVFNNTEPSYSAPKAPSNAPANIVDPFSVTPTYGEGAGFQQDAEIDIVGGIEGDNGVFAAINGSAQLMYANVTHDVFQNVPSAYNWGTDTGETSTGIADYWTPSHVLEINQGPSMLYGLWGAQPQASVPSGDVQIKGTISPSYGFVFVSNSVPVLYPWSESETDNMSWLPTSATGAFNTYLPPLAAPWTTTYYVQAFADGYAEYNTTVTASTTTLAISMTAAPGTLNAPLYMNGAAQASALARALGGTGTAPYLFEYLTVNSNMSFDRLNDWEFPTFEVFQSEDANSVVVASVFLGTDSNGPNGNSYIWDYSVGAAFFSAPMVVFLDHPYVTSGIDIFSGTGDLVADQELESFCPQECLGVNGLQLSLWDDTDALVTDTIAFFDYPGIWVGDSFDTQVTDTTVYYEYGVTDIGSTGTVVSHLQDYSGLGVSAAGSFDSTYEWINVTEGGEGIETGSDLGSTVQSIYDINGTVDLTIIGENVTDNSLGANLTFSPGTTIEDLAVDDTVATEIGSLGFQLDGSPDTVVYSMTAIDGGSFYAWNATDLTFYGLEILGGSSFYENGQVYASTDVTFSVPYIYDAYYEYDDENYGGAGVVGAYDSGVSLLDPDVQLVYGGMVFEYSNDVSATDADSFDSTFAYELDYSTATISVSGVNAEDDYIGFNLFNSYPATVTDVYSYDATGIGNDYGAGVAMYNDTGNTVTTVTAFEAVGVRVDFGASGNTVSNVDAYGYDDEAVAVGVALTDAGANTVTLVSAADTAVGVLVNLAAEGSTITNVNAEDFATGVEEVGALANTMTGINATFYATAVALDPSVGGTVSNILANEYSRGVYIDGSIGVSVTAVTPTNESVAIETFDASDLSFSGIRDVPGSIAVLAVASQFLTISDITGTGTGTAMSPFAYAAAFGVPAAAVDAVGSVGLTITGITVTDFPAAIYDSGSSALTVTAVNATGGYYGIVLNGTQYSAFSGIGAFQDYQGMLLEDGAQFNTITGSSFVDESSYGVAIASGTGNTVYNNNFIGDNGATTTYSPTHVQALAAEVNDFYLCTNSGCTAGVGNYWADWHTYGSNGFLAPYYISGASVDEFPIGPQETFVISFSESGLAAGTSWSVTLSGMTLSATTPYINFTVPMGQYIYQVNPVAGYTETPTGGLITEAGAPYSVPVTFSQTTYAVTLSASGLGSGTSWGATVNGVTQSTTGASLTFYLPAGTGYKYSFNAVSGYNLPATGASGTFNVTNQPVSLATTYSPTSTPSYVQTSDFNNWLGVAIAVAVIALVIGLLALLLRGGRKEQPPAQGAQAWTPPPAQAGGAPPASGGSSSWSEGPPSGGAPPS